MGILSQKRGEYDEAMKFYKRVLELEPKYAQAYSSMAVIELNKNRIYRFPFLLNQRSKS